MRPAPRGQLSPSSCHEAVGRGRGGMRVRAAHALGRAQPRSGPWHRGEGSQGGGRGGTKPWPPHLVEGRAVVLLVLVPAGEAARQLVPEPSEQRQPHPAPCPGSHVVGVHGMGHVGADHVGLGHGLLEGCGILGRGRHAPQHQLRQQGLGARRALRPHLCGGNPSGRVAPAASPLPSAMHVGWGQAAGTRHQGPAQHQAVMPPSSLGPDAAP